MGCLVLLVLGTFCQAFGLVGNEHRDVYDHKYYADLDKVYANGMVTVDIKDLEPGDYVSQFFFEFNSDDKGLYGAAEGTKETLDTEGTIFFQEIGTHKFAIHEFALDIKHIALLDITSSPHPDQDAFTYVEAPWGRMPMYRGLCDIHSDLSRLYAVFDTVSVNNWLRTSEFEPYQEQWTYYDIQQDLNSSNGKYYAGEGSYFEPNALYMKAFEQLLDENKDAFTDNPNDRTVVFLQTNRPFVEDETYKRVREKWAALPSSKRLVIASYDYTKEQLEKLNAEGKKSWEELESWSNAKAFTHYWNANVISKFLVPALK